MSGLKAIILTVPLLFQIYFVSLVAAEGHTKSDHVLLMVFDQMRPDYIDRFDLKNFKRLRKRSVEFSNALVGYVPSITMVSHPVMATGVQPKDLPWCEGVYFDRDKDFGEKAAWYSATRLDVEQLIKLTAKLTPHESIAGDLKQRFPKKIVAAVGEKNYAAITMATPDTDIIVTLEKKDGVCRPAGKNIPETISSNSRFTLNCSEPFGTEKSLYPLDGLHYVPGPENKGGDLWTADAAVTIMNETDWSGMLLTFGGIDRLGHLWGDLDDISTHPFESNFSFPDALKTADKALGIILDELEALHLSDRTVIVLTADHGGQHTAYYMGNNNGGVSGKYENETTKSPPFWIGRLETFGDTAAIVYDSAIRSWLSRPLEKRDIFERAMIEISGTVEVWRKTAAPFKYDRIYQSPKIDQFQKTNSSSLVNAVASSCSPDYIALLGDNVGFDLLGDHGGAQEKVQRIPFFLVEPGKKVGKKATPIQLKDVRKLISKSLD